MSEKLIYIDNNNKLNLSRLRPDQKAFVKSTKLHSGIVGGYQSGKSASARVKIITEQLQAPRVPLAYYLPTYGLIEDMLAPTLSEIYDGLKIKIRHDKKQSKILTPYGEIWMRSMDTPDRIVSYSVGYSLIDEVDVVHSNKRDAAMKRISSRNSFKKRTPNKMDFVSTPEGFGYMYNFFVKKANDNKILYRLSTLDNVDNLGDGYIEGLRELYDEEQLRAYLHGEFVNLASGTVYKNYNRKINRTNRIVTEHDKLHIGMDFNITKMVAIINVFDGEIKSAVDEFTNIYDTEAMIVVINSKYPTHKKIIYPDSSGKNRKTSGKSDIVLLKDAGFTVNYTASNPPVKDRVNVMNSAFKHPKDGRITYYINDNYCPDYAEALEQQGYKKGEPDKTSGLDHVVDAGGYFIYGNNRGGFGIV